MSARACASKTWLVGPCLLAACFADMGPMMLDTSSSGALSTSTTHEELSTSSGAPPTTGTSTGTSTDGTTAAITTAAAPFCGDGNVDVGEACDDGNADDADACRTSCQPASCGDGVVWAGVEECDAGAGNNPTLPGTCRPTCKLPACGDGSLYLGALGDPIELASPFGTVLQGDDSPRSIAVSEDEAFSVIWRVDASPDKLIVEPVDNIGMSLDLLSPPATDVRDMVIAMAPGGDLAVAWESGTDVFMRGIKSPKALTTSFVLHTVNNGTQESPSLALGDGGRAVVAFLGPSGNGGSDVFVRIFPDFATNQAPAEQKISMHPPGFANPPTVAMHPSGNFLVAWGDPGGALIYRRFAADGTAAAPVTTTLRVDNLKITGPKAWAGAALRPTDESAVLVGHDEAGHLTLQRFDAADTLQGAVQVTADDARFAPFVDVASDAFGNLAVVWGACGSPQDVMATTCDGLPSRAAIRWFYSDLAAFGPGTPIYTNTGTPAAIGVAMAPSGVTGVSYIAGNKVLVRLTPLACP